MSNFKTSRPNEDEILSQSSDEKMDTGSESFRSQDTPNSIISSDFDDRSLESNVLRLQNPEDTETNEVLRLSEPDTIRNRNVEKLTLRTDLSDSFVTKMSNLQLNSPKLENRPRHLGISPPKFSSSLVMTTDHPLMGVGSPDYPDVVPKKISKDDEKDLSLSSIEDERPNETNGYNFYSPENNTSKNNLYFSENFTESQMLEKLDNSGPPDVAWVRKERRRIVPKFAETPKSVVRPQEKVSCGDSFGTPGVNCIANEGSGEKIQKYLEIRKKMSFEHSTPKLNAEPEDICVTPHEFTSGVADWCDSPSQLRSVPNFQLPIELSSNISVNDELDSPELVSTSTQEDRSLFQAQLDPYTGSVALRHTSAQRPSDSRRKIQLPPDEDRCSLDSVSVSLESEEEPPELDPEPDGDEKQPSVERDLERSKSCESASEYSDPIPEYSAAEERRDERSWLAVRSGGTDATCDMKVIEPYKRVVSHGGYDAGGAALIVFSACFLPDNRRADYKYVMDNLFLYVIWTLERLVTDEYVLVYLHGSAGARCLPSFRWLHECYKLIDRRLRKNLKHLYLVHPTFWLKSFVVITKPFVSSKFFRKLSYVCSLNELMQRVPVEPNAIPELVKQFDAAQ